MLPVPGNFPTAPLAMDMILLRSSIPRRTSIRSFGKKYRDYCRVRRFWVGEDDEVGRLVHKPGGAEHARWVFDFNPDQDDDDEIGYKFGAHAFVPGEYLSISGQDGKLQTFLVVTVEPVVLSVDLVKSFELEIKV